ncbi:MAG: TonB family protein [Verrucomicrobiota bacterium]|jgi:TonB family protein
MNRLQKKCFMATVGVHLLLVVILLVGPAFFAPKPKADDFHVLDVIPANLIDAPFNSGVRNVQPPPPAPVVTPPQPQPTPPAPKPVEPPPTLAQTLEKIFKPEPVKPAPNTTRPPNIQINTQLVTRTAPKNVPDNAQQARALRNAIQNLKKKFAPGTVVDMPGNSGGAAYANYRDVIASIYYEAWTPPGNADNDEANTKVSITIANDGTVISARIITPSGDIHVDASIQRTLERVTFIAPFPKGAPEKERTYIINFNLKAKRLLG